MNRGQRQRRLDRARFAIQVELLTGLMVLILTAFVSVTTLVAFRPMFYERPLIELLLAAAPAFSLVAWIWMLRLSRPQPEGGGRTWRYHD